MDFKRFRIPNRDVKLTKEEAEITSTRTFQRLFYLKQLGLAYLVYPCATHTRAGHSIECLDEATKLLESVGIHQGDDDWASVRMAALLHDIGHIPFSHTLEDENEVLPKHDKRDRLNAILEKLKEEVSTNVSGLIDEATPILIAIAENDEEKQDWRSDLVGNTVCADLLAYITTDASWTGIEKRPGYYRIYDYFKIAEKAIGRVSNKRFCIALTKGGLRTDIVSAILDLLDMRYALTERVLFHHAKAVASAMLARVARLCNLRERPELLDMGDERFLDYLQILSEESEDKEAGRGSSLLINNLRSRQLYKRIFKVQRTAMEDWDRRHSKGDADSFCAQSRNSQIIENKLKHIERKFELPYGSLVLWCPEGKSGMKLVKSNVVWEQSGGWHDPVELRSPDLRRQFPGVYARVDTIEQQYLDLWTFWVAIHPDFISAAPAVIDELSDQFKIECDEVFLETYAKTRLKDFEEYAKMHDGIKNTFKDHLPGVTKIVYDLAARPGSEIDSSVITEAIHEVSDQKRKIIKKDEKPKKPEQSGIFDKDDPKENF